MAGRHGVPHPGAARAAGAAFFQARGDQEGYVVALSNVGYTRLILGDYAGAAADCAEAAVLYVESGNWQAMCAALLIGAFALLELGDEAEAVTKIQESFAIAREVGFREHLANGLEAFATLAARRDEHVRAARLLGAAEVLRESLGIVLDPFELGAHDRAVASAGQALGPGPLAAAWAEGRSLDLEEALDYAHARATS